MPLFTEAYLQVGFDKEKLPDMDWGQRNMCQQSETLMVQKATCVVELALKKAISIKIDIEQSITIFLFWLVWL